MTFETLPGALTFPRTPCRKGRGRRSSPSKCQEYLETVHNAVREHSLEFCQHSEPTNFEVLCFRSALCRRREGPLRLHAAHGIHDTDELLDWAGPLAKDSVLRLNVLERLVRKRQLQALQGCTVQVKVQSTALWVETMPCSEKGGLGANGEK